VSAPLVVVDADVLGRRRTGDETYVTSLLAALGRLDHGLRLAAVTRNPELVPSGIEAIELAAGSQEWRMAVSLPGLLRRLRPALGHFLYAMPLACPCPAVVSVGDLSFELAPELMPWRQRLVFRWAVPRSVRRAACVLAVSERTRDDLVGTYGVPEERIAVVHHGVDAIFAPGGDAPRDYLLFVGAVQARKDPLAAADAAARVGLPLVVAGPVKEPALAEELSRRGARLTGYVEHSKLADVYRGAACLVLPSRFEGFGLPVLEAMASGTPVVCADEPALREVGGDAAVYAAPGRLGEAVEQALADRARLVEAGRARAALFTWEGAARQTVDVYRAALRAR
jgi:glycosyltransferase involved in cell wall biosynthesis